MTCRMASIFRTSIIAGLVLAAAGHLLAQADVPPSLRKSKPSQLLCIPERLWTCNGIGECYQDDRPETLAAWKFDVVGSRWTMCKRDGSECGDWMPLSSVNDSAFLVIHDSGWHPETFKIDRDTGKFAAVRISGGFQNPSTSPPTTDVREIVIRQRTGTCLVLGK